MRVVIEIRAQEHRGREKSCNHAGAVRRDFAALDERVSNQEQHGAHAIQHGIEYGKDGIALRCACLENSSEIKQGASSFGWPSAKLLRT